MTANKATDNHFFILVFIFDPLDADTIVCELIFPKHSEPYGADKTLQHNSFGHWDPKSYACCQRIVKPVGLPYRYSEAVGFVIELK